MEQGDIQGLPGPQSLWRISGKGSRDFFFDRCAHRWPLVLIIFLGRAVGLEGIPSNKFLDFVPVFVKAQIQTFCRLNLAANMCLGVIIGYVHFLPGGGGEGEFPRPFTRSTSLKGPRRILLFPLPRTPPGRWRLRRPPGGPEQLRDRPLRLPEQGDAGAGPALRPRRHLRRGGQQDRWRGTLRLFQRVLPRWRGGLPEEADGGGVRGGRAARVQVCEKPCAVFDKNSTRSFYLRP